MAHILIMPRQGNTVESCIITDWKVKEGTEVTAETTVCEVETDKASFEVPAGVAGTVLKILQNAGDDVPVLAPIAVIGSPGEDWEKLVSQDFSREAADAAIIRAKDAEDAKGKNEGIRIEDTKFSSNNNAPASLLDADQKNLLFSASFASSAPLRENSSHISPRAKNLAEKEALPLPVQGTGPDGRVIERDVIAALETRSPLTAAAKAAGASAVVGQGTGLGGRVTISDINQPPVPRPSSLVPTETQIKGIRKLISDRMLKSLAETAQFTLNASAPVSRLQDLRARMKEQEVLGYSKITVNDLILFAVSRVLPNYLYMNAHKNGDVVKTFGNVDLGIAVDTPRGLMVPVIRNANLLSLAQISTETKRLAAACQNGSAKPEELSGSTFTVTNLGSLGITSFTPVLNIPEVAILGVCNIELKPIPCPSSPVPLFQPHIGFSLTINHQVVDGAPAARFLKALCEAIAEIDSLLDKEQKCTTQ